MNASKKFVLCLSALCCVCFGNSGEGAIVRNEFASAGTRNLNLNNIVLAQREEAPKSEEIFYYFFYKDGNVIGTYSYEDLSDSLKLDQLQETALIADRVAVSNTEKIPEINYQVEQKQAIILNFALKVAKNMSTHGKMFWWGYQVYFSHQTINDIDSAMSISSAASSGLTAILGAVAAEAGVIVGVLCAFVFTNFAIMKAFDKGDGVTLTQEIWGPGVYWFNSGNCIRGE
ncbi:MAG: hypothetical protein WCR63_04150 [Bacilli bacterium]